jgi:hypothetical protein
MFGFVVLPVTFLGGTYYQWTRLAPEPSEYTSASVQPWPVSVSMLACAWSVGA